jgi:hypothetical protein
MPRRRKTQRKAPPGNLARFSLKSVPRYTASVEAWLADRPEVEIVSRDRGGGYGQTVVRAAPEGVPVADRRRLTENASGAFLDGVRRSMTPIRRALDAGAQMFGRAYVLEGSRTPIPPPTSGSEPR